ncbi:Sucrase/ferredoxin-like family protein [Striga hermonthica]|uniref:Sucrase/ferredoxin-like family protein n=1 Tax=Striga hermonthica TaxID=68872 RepID=A0A9N7N5F4_STRHE|nr:Sucrase/ferredoxin-like family protein [Striga hermonthica]
MESDVDSFIEDVLVNGKPWLSGMQEELAGSYMFVCAHNKRDRRCGVCGPILIEGFKEEIASKLGFEGPGMAMSHLMMFLNCSINELGREKSFDRIWRGQMGAKAKEDEQVEEPKHATETNANVNDKQLSETVTEVETEGVGKLLPGC